MTFPPCFSSFSARPGIDSSTNNRNMLRLNTIRHQQQQSRLFSTIVHHNEQGISPMHTPMRTFEPRSATPDLLPKDGSQDKDEDQDDYIEDDAARMLLALSQIVSKEISADSDCITRENRIFDRVHNKTERLQFHQDTTMKDLRVAASDRSGNRSNNAATIPKSIEIHNRGWGSSYISGTTTNPNSPLETKSIPNELLAPLSSAFSPLTPSTLSLNNNHINSFELFGPSTEQRARNRYRTVSLAGDEMIPDNYPELSPLLFPLSSPVLSRNLAASFEIHDSNDSPPHQISRRQLPRLLSNNHQNLEKETVSRALVGGGAKAFSVALAASAIDVPVAVITPVPEKPRPVLSFPTSKPNVEERRSNNGVVVSSTTKNNSGRSLIHENNTDDHKMHSPMDLPPLLFQSNNNKNNKISSKHTPKVSVVVAPLCVKPYKQTASVRKAVTSKKQKSQQPAKGPRAKKKKTTPKRHTGKKFSWKAYPELEEFLITNREEYLSYSAKNYTIEQRDYNNRLTSRLLEHADASNYFTLFESCAFSAVRDRIRSYYKSYVQSFKRRKERQEQQERLKNLEMDRH